MSKDLLVEIGTEEIPARFISDAVNQLATRLTDWLQESKITFAEVLTYSTPRRLAVIVKDVAEKQEDIVEEVRGPSLKIAKDEVGNWTKAAQGFARGQGVSVEKLIVKEIKNVEYVFAIKEYQGQEVEQLLPSVIKGIIQSMTFPKNMRWGNQELRFVRPIRWLLTLFGDKLIPIEITDVKSDFKSYGHRFIGQTVTVPSAEQYKSLLKEQFVIVDPAERKELILKQINDLAAEKDWNVPIDEELLEEVVNLVEYPTVLFGSFKEEFLDIPKEVLITTMKEHQRYFPVEDKAGSLLPYFITVRNGDRRSLELVSKGNEKVLTARLADARFFYLEDQKLEISEAVSKLENVVFQEGLGTIGDKVRRITEVSSQLGNLLKLDENTLKNITRTSEICKFDLVTNMVYEFPELQGLMGEKYSRMHGENEEVSKGIFEHYLPRFSGDSLPETVVGQVVSIADKMDNIVGSFSIGKIPTGSQDPLGLRRQAAGIVQILLEKLNNISLKQLFDLAIEAYEQRGLLKRSKNEILLDLDDFFTLRLKNLMQEKGIRYDVIEAVLETDKNDVKRLVDKALSISTEIDDPTFKNVVDSLTRVMNIATKAEKSDTDPSQYVEDEEMNLYKAFEKLQQNTVNVVDAMEILQQLKALKEPIDAYFNKVMVMVDDDKLRSNRLGLLLSISNYIRQYADFNKLVFA
ncbi:glycine--tRNA ligase subunit beta [Vulcanibacillus modesticaldus]|uniref:Glycine--tRNA ligase beta subunit n=1 Tax=Vulcanibacillus modesticaldus TaxID=337097 RepID=A0A1D2YVI7_9BACI|nr:glycine--tRNA ligase subunit beta [Vulcanibacillus modesticaldus]OEF99734.1 glycine--tRNA ligase subunit beta [Vulcanibacillus modesticaldus]